MAKANKQKNKEYFSKPQRATLITCTLVMASYILLAYFITLGSFWTFASVHLVLLVISAIAIGVGGINKTLNSIVVVLAVLGASTALGLMLYYLIILNNLANS